MVLNMKVTGRMTCRKVMVPKYGQTGLATLEIIKRVKSTTMESMSGLMVPNMREIGMKIK